MSAMLRIRITIEYNPDWSEVAIESMGKDRLLINEIEAWSNGHIAISDVIGNEGKVRFETIDDNSI